MTIRFMNKDLVPKPRSTDHFSFCDLMNLNRPIVIEIGCGVGLHPLKYIVENPSHLMIAIEQTQTRYKKFERRILQHKTHSHLFPVHADAVHWIVHNVPLESVTAYYILYPNPNLKHKKRQWHQMPFTRELIKTLKPLGTLTFATNEPSYFQEAYQAFVTLWGLSPIEAFQVPIEFRGRTHFERKFLRQKVPCYNFVVQKPLF